MDIDGSNGAVLRSNDLVLHLHSLKDGQHVASLDGIASLDLDVQNVAGHGSLNSNSTGSTSGSGRSSSRSLGGSGSGRSSHRSGSNGSSASGSLLNRDAVSNAIDGNIVVLHGRILLNKIGSISF